MNYLERGVPQTEEALLRRAEALAGHSLGSVAKVLGLPVPESTVRAKGWTGQLVEMALGASAGPRPVPDFELIGVELKTVPVDAQGRVGETTFICTVPLEPGTQAPRWRSSNLWGKLKRILWVPVLAEAAIPLSERIVGFPLLWSPSPQEEAMLKADWEELMDLVCLGQVEEITAHHGTYLQIRPKAANSKARRWGVGTDGSATRTMPRGFYLRARFTAALLRQYYV